MKPGHGFGGATSTPKTLELSPSLVFQLRGNWNSKKEIPEPGQEGGIIGRE
jgi:hypothetical protein